MGAWDSGSVKGYLVWAIAVALQMQHKECFFMGYNGTGSVEELLGK
jgi:hypothetical protein